MASAQGSDRTTPPDAISNVLLMELRYRVTDNPPNGRDWVIQGPDGRNVSSKGTPEEIVAHLEALEVVSP